MLRISRHQAGQFSLGMLIQVEKIIELNRLDSLELNCETYWK